MVVLAVAVSVVVIVAQIEVLVGAVRGESDRRDAQAGEAAAEPIPSREVSLISPCVSVGDCQPALATSRNLAGLD